MPELRNITAEPRHLSNNRQHMMKRPFFSFLQPNFTEKKRVELVPPHIKCPSNRRTIYRQALKLVENEPTIHTSPQARREQQHKSLRHRTLFVRNARSSDVEPTGTPSNRIDVQRPRRPVQSRYGWPRRVNVYENSFNRANPEPIYRRSN